MRALQQCHLEDIGRFDRVKIECQRGRTVRLRSSIFDGLPNDLPVLDLRPRFRCDSCSEKGKVNVSMVCATYASRRGWYSSDTCLV
jgi:hypothetical protein